MEDSLDLPASQDQLQQINFAISPNMSNKKMNRLLHNAGSQESLAYSNQTYKYLGTDRSPIHISIPNFESSQKAKQLKHMLRAGKNDEDDQNADRFQDIMRKNSEQVKKISNFQKKERKTINKNEVINLSRKNKELQYALQLQMIVSQQLRTKVTVLSELLEERIKDAGLQKLLKLKNSSKEQKNVDIFIQLKKKQKQLSEKNLLVEKQKQQIRRLLTQNSLKTSRKQNIDTSNMNVGDVLAELQGLKQQKQSLFLYIEELKKHFAGKQAHCKELQTEVQRIQEKETKFIQIERPKFIHQISERSQKVKELEEELESLKMENQLIGLNYQSQIEELKKTVTERGCGSDRKRRIQAQMMANKRQIRHTECQTSQVQEFQILKAQTILLKTERDHYMKEYKKKIQQNSQIHFLRMQVQTLKRQLSIV